MTRGPAAQTLVAMVFVTALLVLTLIDLDHLLLPDAITLPGVALGLAASSLPGSPVSPLEAGLAAAGGWLAFALVALLWKKLRGIDALGEGDWKMAAMLGTFFGWERLLLTVLLASASGALVGVLALVSRRGGWRSTLPLGTFLGLAGIVMVFFGDAILDGYRELAVSFADRSSQGRPSVVDLRRTSIRLGVALALTVVGLFEVLSLLQGVRSVRRLRARVADEAEQRVEAARPTLAPVLALGGAPAWDAAAQVALSRGLAREVEVIEAGGRVLFSRPTAAPVVNRLGPEQRSRLAAGRTVSVVAQEGPAVRVLVYVPLPGALGRNGPASRLCRRPTSRRNFRSAGRSSSATSPRLRPSPSWRVSSSCPARRSGRRRPRGPSTPTRRRWNGCATAGRR